MKEWHLDWIGMFNNHCGEWVLKSQCYALYSRFLDMFYFDQMNYYVDKMELFHNYLIMHQQLFNHNEFL